MQAGKLRNRVTIQQIGTTQDEIGQTVTGWEDVATVSADIRYLNGIERLKADSSTSLAKASIRIRYREGINAGMRIVHGTTAYNIAAVLPDVGKKQHVDLVCEVINGQ